MIKIIQINLVSLNSTESVLIDLVNTLVQGIHVLEYIILAYGFSSFLHKMDSMKLNMLKHGAIAIISRKRRTALIIVLIVLDFAILLVSPSVYILTTRKSPPDFDPYIYYYTGVLYASHITNGGIRAAMIITVLLIIEAWKSATYSLSNPPQSLADESTMREYFTSLITNYTSTGHLVSSLNAIFQGWFVIQWVTYFIDITVSCALLFSTIIQKNLQYDPTILDILAQLLYFISALAIPYTCGVVINNHHKDYRKYLVEKQKMCLSESQDFRVYIMQTASLIPLNSEYLFIPSLCGLSIPLNSTGHGITILLTLLAFVLSLRYHHSAWA